MASTEARTLDWEELRLEGEAGTGKGMCSVAPSIRTQRWKEKKKKRRKHHVMKRKKHLFLS